MGFQDLGQQPREQFLNLFLEKERLLPYKQKQAKAERERREKARKQQKKEQVSN